MSHDHDHYHHDHDHPDDSGSELSDMDLRVRTLESLLVEKGHVDPGALDVLIETYETRVGPHNGARVVAKAWADQAYRKWLLENATAAIASLGFTGRGADPASSTPYPFKPPNACTANPSTLHSSGFTSPGLLYERRLKRSGFSRMATCSLLPLPAGRPRRSRALAMPESILSLPSGRSSWFWPS